MIIQFGLTSYKIWSNSVKQILNQTQKQILNINQELSNAINLLKLNEIELLDEIKNSYIDNVFIDIDYKDNSFTDKSIYDMYENVKVQNDFREELLSEFSIVESNPKRIKICEYILYNLDEYGYLQEEDRDISYKFKVSLSEVKYIREIINNLSIEGLALHGTKDYLLFQVSDLKIRDFILNYYEEICSCSYNKILEKSNIDKNQLTKIIEYLTSLKPYPLYGLDVGNTKEEFLYPDYTVTKDENILEVKMNNIFDININEDYIQLMNSSIYAGNSFLHSYYKQACLVVNAIRIRRINSKKVIESIVDCQKEFFLNSKTLNILKQREIAELTNLSISTVSRIVDNKILEFENRYYKVEDFFDSGISSIDAEYSRSFITEKIENIVRSENKENPYSDNSICNLLNLQGIPVKRRTVTQYRIIAGIENSRTRANYK